MLLGAKLLFGVLDLSPISVERLPLYHPSILHAGWPEIPYNGLRLLRPFKRLT